MSIFIEYYNKYISESEYTKTEEIFNFCIEKINNEYSLSTYCDGINGFLFSLIFLQNNNFISEAGEDLFRVLDEHIKEWFIIAANNDNFDFLHGSSGCVLYFINKISNDEKDFETLINLYIDGLKRQLKNITDYRDLKKEQTIQNRTYLGLAHGIAGLISILGKLSQITAFKEKSLYLINEYTFFLLNTINSKGNKISLFPSWLTQSESIKKDMSALSWCIGDIGIGISLLNTAENIQNSTLKVKAIEILEHSAKRISKNDSLITSPEICHGFFGVYKIFSRAYTLTQEKTFMNARDFWLHKGLDHIKNNSLSKNLSILNGQAGIGLALIDAYTETDHNWGECLLIS